MDYYFRFSSGKPENKHPINPWPRPDIVNIVLLSELYAKYFYSDNQLMSRQGGPVNPVRFINALATRDM